jgi:hypothetical protein
MIIEYKNPIRVFDNMIECEINHKDFGWIPFGCSREDPYPYFNCEELYDAMLADSNLIDARPTPLSQEEDLYNDAAMNVRLERKEILSTRVDPIMSNPFRWADLSQERQNEWIEYRNALLDITEQEGFPFNVVWPVRPKKK